MEYPAKLLKNELAKLKERNPRYSMRSFSRSLGISPSSLSQIMSGKRRMSMHVAKKVADQLKLAPEESRTLFASIPDDELQPEDRFEAIELDQFRTIADWYHYGILSVIEMPDADTSVGALSKRLGVPRLDIRNALDRLLRLGVISPSPGGYERTGQPLCTEDNVQDRGIRRFIKQNLELADSHLRKAQTPTSDYSAIVMAADPEKIEKAKEEIKRFRRRLCALLETGEQKKVMSLSIQLFSMEAEDRP